MNHQDTSRYAPGWPPQGASQTEGSRNGQEVQVQAQDNQPKIWPNQQSRSAISFYPSGVEKGSKMLFVCLPIKIVGSTHKRSKERIEEFCVEHSHDTSNSQVCGVFFGPLLLLLWSTLPELWSKISSSDCLVGDNLSRLLDLPSGLLFSGKAVVKSLTCDNLDLEAAGFIQSAPVVKERLVSPISSPEKRNLVPLQAPAMPPPALTCMPWLLTGLVLMGLNTYFPQLSPVLSLWSPL
ncbi:hypothetical protein DSO57_1031457 [Entomophthora muscae]|uniref:Uncharacterized protein n=1 Tax=Entomophthora muscae TaxID=34485 RepID=A0ACC2RFC5_9FUNG|nr:hypothetical protein DSO57_1031457 [Entomophthora muscae]